MRSGICGVLFIMVLASCGKAAEQASTPAAAESRINAALRASVEDRGFDWGAEIFIRIFKETDELEVWLGQIDGTFARFRTYPICAWSGSLGPKLKEGDGQSPEGFYVVTPSAMNPRSQFHLSFNLGFPNAYDRAKGRTGSFLMVHGDCVSIGCYAMTDAGIEEIYLLADAAFAAGQPFFRVHIFPFRMTDERLNAVAEDSWIEFWRNLKTGHDWFETRRRPPEVTVADGAYVFTAE